MSLLYISRWLEVSYDIISDPAPDVGAVGGVSTVLRLVAWSGLAQI